RIDRDESARELLASERGSGIFHLKSGRGAATWVRRAETRLGACPWTYIHSTSKRRDESRRGRHKCPRHASGRTFVSSWILNPSHRPALREAAVEQARELVYVGLSDVQRRRDAEHVAVQ